jgi:hypothetical protein
MEKPTFSAQHRDELVADHAPPTPLLVASFASSERPEVGHDGQNPAVVVRRVA